VSARPPAFLLAALLTLGLTACQGDESIPSGVAAARPASTTSDPGSRYLDAAGPVGGLTEETPPTMARPAPRPATPSPRARNP